MDNVIKPNQILFKDKHNKRVVNTSNMIMFGSHICDKKLLKAPQPQNASAISIDSIYNSPSTNSVETLREMKPNELTKDALYQILHQTYEVNTDKGN